MLETIGTRLRQARQRRCLEVEQVAEATKIRPERILDLEADDYSHFPNLTYARSFLAKYAGFLRVDVHEELDNFRVSHPISLAEYQYLSSPPARRYAPEAGLIAPRAFRVPPVLVGVLVLVVLVGVPVFAYLAVGLSRLQPRSGEVAGQDQVAVASPTPDAATSSPSVPLRSWLEDEDRAAPAEPATPAPSAADPAAMLPPALAVAGSALAPPLPASPPPTDPEPPAVDPATTPPTEPAPKMAGTDEALPAPAPVPASPAASEGAEATGSLTAKDGGDAGATGKDGKRLEVRALKRAYIRVVRDKRHSEPVFSGYTSPAANPIVVEGQRFWLKVSDRRAVEVREDGQVVKGGSASIVIN